MDMKKPADPGGRAGRDGGGLGVVRGWVVLEQASASWKCGAGPDEVGGVHRPPHTKLSNQS